MAPDNHARLGRFQHVRSYESIEFAFFFLFCTRAGRETSEVTKKRRNEFRERWIPESFPASPLALDGDNEPLEPAFCLSLLYTLLLLYMEGLVRLFCLEWMVRIRRRDIPNFFFFKLSFFFFILFF